MTLPPLLRVLHGVGEQVDRRLQQHVAIGQHAQVQRAELAGQRDLLLLGRRLHDADRLVQQLVERQRRLVDRHDARLDPRQVQQVVDQPLQAVGLAVDDAQELLAGRVVVGFAIDEQLDIGPNAGQRRLHLVADRRDELRVPLLNRLLAGDIGQHGHGAVRRGRGRSRLLLLAAGQRAAGDAIPVLLAVLVGQRHFAAALRRGAAAARLAEQADELLAAREAAPAPDALRRSALTSSSCSALGLASTISPN